MKGGGPSWRGVQALPQLAFLLLFLALAAAACGPGIEREPALPTGFEEAPLPDVAIKGYLYMWQSDPLSIATSRLVEDSTPPPGFPTEAGLSRWAVWVGPDPKAFGMLFEVTDEAVLDLVVQEREKRTRGEFRHIRKGKRLYLLKGEGEWIEALRASIEEERYGNLQGDYPEVWKLLKLLPERPPSPPVAAGFGKLDEDFLDSLEREFGSIAGDARRLSGAARVKNAVFSLYAQKPPGLLGEFTQDFLKEMGLEALIVTRSGYPGFVVNILFGNVAPRIGLEKVTLGEQEVFYIPFQEDAHLMVKNRGSAFFVAIAPWRDRSEALMRSALE